MKEECTEQNVWLAKKLENMPIDYASAYLIGVIESCINAKNSPEKTVDEIKSALASFNEAAKNRTKKHES